MTFLARKLKSLRGFALTFPDSKMENEYNAIQNLNQMTDFQVTVLVVVFVVVVTNINTLIILDMNQFYITLAMIVVLIVIYLLRNYFSKYINYLALLVIFSYNLYRLFLMVETYKKLVKASAFNSGYTYAILQTILLGRIHNVYFRTFGMVAAYALRFGLIIGLIDDYTVDIASMIRHFIVDTFVLYYFFSKEKTSRKVFQDFDDKREELMKFKELLEEYLPQSVTVIDCANNKALFSNKTFLNAFARQKSDRSLILETGAALNLLNPSNDAVSKPEFELLSVNKSTIRQIGDSGTSKECFSPMDNQAELQFVIKHLIEKKLIKDNAFSLTASFLSAQEPRSFEVILKGIKWDRTNAVAVIINEITDQERVIALKLADQNKDKILATVSHEFRTPLNGIIGLLELAEKKMIKPEALEYIALSKDNAYLLLSLVNSYLDLQQIRAGKLNLNPCKINLFKVLNDITQLLNFQTSQKGIYLKSVVHKEVPRYIITDENRFKQILINLIGNAVKFTKVGGITIEIYQNHLDRRYLEVSVVDTGIGIKEEDKGKLFQMYGKLEEGRNVNKTGIGLGLTISNLLAGLLSGKKEEKAIEVSSKYGEGSKFHFRILKNLEESKNIEEHKEFKRGTLEHKLKNNEDEDEENHEKDSMIIDYCCEESLTPININTRQLSYNFLKKLNMKSMYKYKTAETFEGLLNDNCTNMEKFQSEIPLIEEFHKDYVVVVDDNPFNQLVIKNLLEDMNFNVEIATGGQEAIEVILSSVRERKSIKVILMDCHMPVMDGYETAIILRDMMDKKEIPVIPIFALTASTNEEDRKKCFECGMQRFLEKPLRKEVILKEFSKIG